MANICFNFIQAFGESDAIVKLKEYLKRHDFNEVEVVSLHDIGIEKSNTGIEFTLETRWSPPAEWVCEMSEKFLGVLLECEYEECGCDIWGKFGFRDGVLLFTMELPYLEGKHKSMVWNEFIECEVAWRLNGADSFDEFIAPFKEFCSDGEIEELEELFFEYANEN